MDQTVADRLLGLMTALLEEAGLFSRSGPGADEGGPDPARQTRLDSGLVLADALDEGGDPRAGLVREVAASRVVIPDRRVPGYGQPMALGAAWHIQMVTDEVRARPTPGSLIEKAYRRQYGRGEHRVQPESWDAPGLRAAADECRAALILALLGWRLDDLALRAQILYADDIETALGALLLARQRAVPWVCEMGVADPARFRWLLRGMVKYRYLWPLGVSAADPGGPQGVGGPTQ